MAERPWPALFLNAIWSDNGRRIVAASLRTDTLAPPRDDEVLFKDLLTTLGGDIRLSTAAHNSARFPLVSPPGGWRPAEQTDQEWQRLQDGGLFENYGAETLLEIAAVAERLWREKWDMTLQPYVILISSDPTLPMDLADFPHNDPLGFGYEVLSTLRSYATSRSGHGVEAASRLQRWVENRSPVSEPSRFFHLRMCGGDENGLEPPLGWFLSTKAQAEINRYLSADNPCSQENAQALARLSELMPPASE